MKILHISKYYYPYSGGIEDVCYNIVKYIKEHEQKVLCFNNKNIDETEFIDDVEIIRIGIIKEIASQPISFLFYKKLKKIIQVYKPDIIHLHLPNPLICLYLYNLISNNCKLVLHWHSDIIAQKKLYKLFKPIEYRILKRANSIIVTSPLYLDNSIPLKNFKHKCTIIPNPISIGKMTLDHEDIDKINNIKNLYHNKKIVFFMGRHVPYKGIEYLIKAEKFIQYNNYVILIAGTGPLTKKLKQLTESNNIHFLGRIPDNEIKIYMNASSVFAFPSITKNEAFGVVLAEAMFCKSVPVCFSIKGSGVNWVTINGVTGIEVENSNSHEFAKAIDSLLFDEAKRNKLAENAYNRVIENFTINKIGEQITELYKSL